MKKRNLFIVIALFVLSLNCFAEKFNEYKMCLIGEEILGVPGIGFVEGMACGCAYFGKRGYYEDYGMKEGVHYIAYDGSPDDLLEKRKNSGIINDFKEKYEILFSLGIEYIYVIPEDALKLSYLDF